MSDVREDEVEMLRSMFTEEELQFPGYPEELFEFTLQLSLDDPEAISLVLGCKLPDGYPEEPAAMSISCDRIRREQNDQMVRALGDAMRDLDADEMRVLAAMEWIREHAAQYLAQAATGAAPKKAAGALSAAPRPVKGFMREWCSFVSLYKDSYISGPNRFEVMTSLAKGRGLNITGMGISGKPGGLVVEGEEGDIVEFMNLMRTEFFETLNPRGRKLTTRLQERWPLDAEDDRYEAAEIVDRVRKDAYRAADRADGGKKFKPGEKERLEKWESDDKARLEAWKTANRRELANNEVDELLAAGPPAKCSTKGVYNKCGCEEPPTREEIDSRRLFQDFTIFQGKEGFEAAYQEAAKTFKDLGRMDGFDAMFTYRFS